MTDTHFGMMATMSRMGFSVVPRVIKHGEKGLGTLFMDGEGIRFEPLDGSDPISATWGEIKAEAA